MRKHPALLAAALLGSSTGAGMACCTRVPMFLQWNHRAGARPEQGRSARRPRPMGIGIRKARRRGPSVQKGATAVAPTINGSLVASSHVCR